jgi:hypothetical protein
MPSFGPPPVEIGMGSNAANARRPARNPPICACHAIACSTPAMLIEPSPKGGDGCPEGLDSSGGGLAQDCLELGEELLDRVEVWRIGRQAEQPGAACLDGRAHACDVVRAEIVQDHDVAGPQRRCEHLLDIGAEPFAVDRSTMTKGAVSPSQRRPATKVVVFQ